MDTITLPAGRITTRVGRMWGRIDWRRLGPWLAMGAAMLPMWIVHGRNLWSQPQFQVFPLLYVVLLGLMYQEVRIGGSLPTWRRWLAIGLLVLSGLAFVVSVAMYSPYVGQLAGILWLVGGLMAFASSVSLWRITAYGSLLVLTIIPRAASLQLSQGLQRVTSVASSGLLETLRIPHIRSGNLIEVPGRVLFVDEACSGIQSLFAALCVVVIIAVVQRSSFLITALSLASVPFWALMGNLVRVVTISVAQTRWQVDLSRGWQHDLLGYVNFVIIAVFLLIWVKLLVTLLAPIPRLDESAPPLLMALFNRGVQWPLERRRGGSARAGQARGMEGGEPDVTGGESTAGRLPRRATPIAWAGVAILLVVGALNLSFMVKYGEGLFGLAPEDAFDFSIAESLPGENAFAEVQQLWPVTRYQEVERDMSSIFGNFSHTWRIAAPSDFLCVASLDFPFFGFHDLTHCYQGSGWEITRNQLVSLDEEVDSGQTGAASDEERRRVEGLVELDLQRRASGQFGFVLFGLIDQYGRISDPPRAVSLGGQLRRHLRAGPFAFLISGDRERYERERALLQFQVFCEKDSPFGEQELESVRRQFMRAFAVIRRQSASAFQAGEVAQR